MSSFLHLPALRSVAQARPQHVPPMVPSRPLTEKDAVDIWIARWLRIRRKDLLDRYGCDPRRLYEIWEEERFTGARAKAIEQFRTCYPTLVDRIDYGRHKRISRAEHPDQLSLFE
jgi:hypothetical protein